MIRDFNMTREENIGYYCGLLVSVMAMAQIMAGKKNYRHYRDIGNVT